MVTNSGRGGGGGGIHSSRIKRLRNNGRRLLSLRIRKKNNAYDHLRIPYVNTLPNRKVLGKESENRGKYSKARVREKIEQEIRDGKRLSNSKDYQTDYCTNCGSFSDDTFVHTPEYEVVCKKCGKVQDSEIAFEGAVERLYKVSAPYKKRTYISERLRLFGNYEPRICRQHLRIIGQVYSELDSRYCKILDEEQDPTKRTEKLSRMGLADWWIEHPADLTKEFIKTLLTLIDSLHPKIKGTEKSFRKKYSERWLQVKIFICGDHYFLNHISSLPSKELLDAMLILSNCIANVYENERDLANICSRKKSMPNLDLLFLLVLYNLEESFVEIFGWYFLSNKGLIEYQDTGKSTALEKDFEIFQRIFSYLNSNLPLDSEENSYLRSEENLWLIPSDLEELLSKCKTV